MTSPDPIEAAKRLITMLTEAHKIADEADLGMTRYLIGVTLTELELVITAAPR